MNNSEAEKLAAQIKEILPDEYFIYYEVSLEKGFNKVEIHYQGNNRPPEFVCSYFESYKWQDFNVKNVVKKLCEFNYDLAAQF